MAGALKIWDGAAWQTIGGVGPNGPPTRQVILTDATTARTLALTDEDDMIVFTAATTIALTIPLNASVPFIVGARIDICQTGAGRISVSFAGTLRATPNAILRTIGSAASLLKIGTDEWLLTGDLGG